MTLKGTSTMLRRSHLVISFLLSACQLSFASCPLRDGDVVFIKSQSEQARLLKIATDSEWSHVGMAFKRASGWDVIEAVGPVRWTTLESFVRRSRFLHFEIKRPLFSFDSKKLKASAEAQLGKSYDLIFGWNDERWYCTELVWKAYKETTKNPIASLEKIGDLNVHHPAILAEAQKRFEGYGEEFNLDEWLNEPIITPVHMLESAELESVTNHRKNPEDMVDCLKSQKRN